jgi:hypothetical protein
MAIHNQISLADYTQLDGVEKILFKLDLDENYSGK